METVASAKRTREVVPDAVNWKLTGERLPIAPVAGAFPVETLPRAPPEVVPPTTSKMDAFAPTNSASLLLLLRPKKKQKS